MAEVSYKLVIKKDNEDVLILGNIPEVLLHINDIEINRDSRIASGTIDIDNLNGRYDNEFTDFNEFDLYVSNLDYGVDSTAFVNGEEIEGIEFWMKLDDDTTNSAIDDVTGFEGRWLLNDNANNTEDDNNGTVNGGVQFQDGAKFDGIDDSIDIANPEFHNYSKVLMMGWFKPALVQTGYAAGQYGLTSDRSLLIYQRDNSWRFYISSGNYITGAGGVAINEFQHIAGYTDGTTKKIYVNGLLTTTLTDGAGIGTATSDLRIAGRILDDNYWQGSVKDFMYFKDDEANKTDNEILEIYNRSKAQFIGFEGESGHWTLNGDAIDYSGNNGDGTWVGTEQYEEGIIENTVAAKFDGASQINTNIFTEQQDKSFLLSALIKKELDGTWQTIISKDFHHPSMLIDSDNHLWARFQGLTTSFTAISTATITVADGWTHCMVQYDVTTNILQLYINGSPDGSVTTDGTFLPDTTHQYIIGRLRSSPYYHYYGLIQDVRLVNRKLRDSERARIINEGLGTIKALKPYDDGKQFDKAAEVNGEDYIDTNFSWGSGLSSGARSVSHWFTLDDFNDDHALFFRLFGNSSYPRLIYIKSTDRIVCQYPIDGVTQTKDIITAASTKLSIDTPYNFIGIWDADLKTFEGYFDNVLKSTGSHPTMTLFNGGSATVLLGRDSSGFNAYQRGKTFDFRPYNGRLTEEERNAIWNGGLGNIYNRTRLNKRFAGEVREATPDENNFSRSLLCKDWNFWLSERAWVGVRNNIDLGQLIYEIFEEKFPEFDLSEINTSTGVIIDKFVSDSKYVNTILDELFKENDWNLIVDYNKVVKFFEINRGSSQIVLNSGNNGNVLKQSINLKSSNLTNKNSVTVIGGKETIEGEVDDFIYTGGSQFFTLYNRASEVTTVKVNTVPTSNWNLSGDGINLEVVDVLSVNDVVEITYDYEIPVWHREQDIGATKLRELIIKDPNILTSTRAENYSKALLAQVNVSITKGTVASDKIIEDFQWLQTLTLGDVNGFTGEQTIKAYTEYIGAIHTVTFNLSQVLDENTRVLFNLIREIETLKGTDDTDITIVDGFIVTDILNMTEEITGFEKGKGTRWIINDFGEITYPSNWWTFNETLIDSLGDNDGVWIGQPTYNTGKVFNKSASIDNTNYLEFTETIDVQSDFYICGWFKRNNASDGSVIDFTPASDNRFWLRIVSDDISANIYDGVNAYGKEFNQVFNTAEWYFFEVVNNSASNEIQLFINRNEASISYYRGSSISSGNYIGGGSGSTSADFDIENVRKYNIIPTTEERDRIYNNGDGLSDNSDGTGNGYINDVYTLNAGETPEEEFEL